MPDIDPKLIHSIPWYELMERVVFGLRMHAFQNKVIAAENCLFDQAVARKLRRVQKSFDVFYGFHGGALSSLKTAKAMSRTTVLDHHDVNHQFAAKLLQEESELSPEFRKTIPFWPPIQKYLERLENENVCADFHSVPSNFAKRTYVENGMPEANIFVVPLCVNLQRFTPRETRKGGKFRILFCGAIGQRKGIKYLLEACKKLPAQDCELVLAGQFSGDQKVYSKYRDYFKHVLYVEPTKMADFYRQGDVFVLPSLYDGFGQVIIEAMACGLPVIITENTGGSDIITDGVEGYIVPIRDADAIAEKLLILHRNKELRIEMGRNACERAKTFSVDAYTKRVQEIMSFIHLRTLKFGQDKN